MAEKPLTKAQAHILNVLKDAPAKDGKSLWWQVVRDEDGSIYFPSAWQGVNRLATFKVLQLRGFINFESHPLYPFAFKVTLTEKAK